METDECVGIFPVTGNTVSSINIVRRVPWWCTEPPVPWTHRKFRVWIFGDELHPTELFNLWFHLSMSVIRDHVYCILRSSLGASNVGVEEVMSVIYAGEYSFALSVILPDYLLISAVAHRAQRSLLVCSMDGERPYAW